VAGLPSVVTELTAGRVARVRCPTERGATSALSYVDRIAPLALGSQSWVGEAADSSFAAIVPIRRRRHAPQGAAFYPVRSRA
jgi:hypothetical protein